MKISQFKSLAQTLIAASVLTTAAHASVLGPRDSGGGHFVKMPDGSTVMADRFALDIDSPFGEIEGVEYQLTAELSGDINRAIWFLNVLGADKAVAFGDEQVYNSEVKYFLSNSLPDHSNCKEDPKLVGVPDGAKIYQGACTDGFITVILADGFNQMSRRERMKLILHERLRNWNAPMPLINIKAITEGIGLALTIFEEQKNGKHTTITTEEQKTLTRLLQGMARTRLSSDEIYKHSEIVLNGGGLKSKHCKPDALHPTATLGVGAALYLGATIGESTRILGSELSIGRGRIGNNVTIQNSTSSRGFGDYSIEDGARIIDSTIYGYNIVVGQNASIDRSHLFARTIKIGAGATLVESRIESDDYLVVGNSARILSTNLRLSDGNIVLNSGTEVSKVDWMLCGRNTTLVLEENSHVSNSSKLSIDLEESLFSRAKLTIPEGSRLDFSDINEVCGPGMKLVTSGSEVIKSVRDFKDFCTKR